MSLICITSSKGGDARRDVLAVGGGGRTARVMRFHQRGDQRRDILGQRMAIGRVVGEMDLAHAGDLRGFVGHRARRPATSRCTSPSLEAAVTAASVASLTALIVVFDPDERLHFATPRALSFSTSSSTSSRP
jgi:hypothetical protein